MRKTTIAALALVVNLTPLLAAAAEPTLEECKAGISEWFWNSDLVTGMIKSDEGIAIGYNPGVLEALRTLDPDAHEHAEACFAMVTSVPMPEEWEEGPWEPDPPGEVEF